MHFLACTFWPIASFKGPLTGARWNPLRHVLPVHLLSLRLLCHAEVVPRAEDPREGVCPGDGAEWPVGHCLHFGIWVGAVAIGTVSRDFFYK